MTSLDDFEEMLRGATPMISQILNSSTFVETKSTRQITTLLWPRNVQAITFRNDYCVITKDDIKRVIEGKFAGQE